MTTNATRDLEARLLRPAGTEGFDPAELEGLPEPVRRHLTQAIAPGTPPHTSARLTMRGQIKVGRRLPFRARQVLSPGHGFIWTARAAGVIAGTDRYVDGAGALRWRLAGLITVAAGDGRSRPSASTARSWVSWPAVASTRR